MNKTAIKNFSIWARNKLIADISYRAGLLGITEEGIANPLPQSTDTTEFYDIGTTDPYTISGIEVRQRKDLVDAIHRKEADSDYETAYNYIIEEVAYTWFNRLIAVRFMEVNDYLPSHIRVLSAESGKTEPDLVTTPFDADLEFTAEEEKQIINLKCENALDEMFRLLFVKQCNALNNILPGLFEKTGDYTELLLNLSVTDKDGVVYHLVHDIDETDFDIETKDESGNAVGQVEIIGWLYQYYNTEPKAKVFDRPSGTKIKKEEIPAATQLFTPDWIVRYMVENSLGRLWLEGHPNNELKTGWKYYFEEAEQDPKVAVQLGEIRKEHSLLTPEDIKIIDPCMGSGHILVYAFDVLMKIYEIQGYTKQNAVKSILEDNIYGLDIDERAAQLSYFSVMMKARSYDKRFFSRNIRPHVYTIRESNNLSKKWLPVHGQMQTLFDCMEDAKDYGSLIVTPDLDYNSLRCFALNRIQETGQLDFAMDEMRQQLSEVLSLIDVAEILSQKYDVVVTNPPYMGSSGMNSKLSKFVKEKYFDTKTDLFSCFIERGFELAKKNKYISMITMESWMFLSSFEKMRVNIIKNKTVINMVHMPYIGRGGTSLGINFGTAAVIFENCKVLNYKAKFDCIRYYETDSEGIPLEFPVINERYKTASLDTLSIIPGSPVAYWCGKEILNAYCTLPPMREFGDLKHGMTTGKNEKCLKNWFEINRALFFPNAKDQASFEQSGCVYVPYNKGGAYQKWYGNLDYVIGYNKKYNDYMDTLNGHRHDNSNYYYKESITWSLTNSSYFGARKRPAGSIFDVNGMSMFVSEKRYYNYILALMCTKVSSLFMRINNPTLASQVGDVAKIPVCVNEVMIPQIDDIASRCIALTKMDWDSFETSWDFLCHPLVHHGNTLKSAFATWNLECNTRFNCIKANEEELNRIFIDIYGLQDELTEEVEDKDVTIHKANLQRDIRSFLSYAVGCMFGRYSLDVNGLAYAGGEWDDSKYVSFQPDADDIIPITDEEYLEDDIVSCLCQWLKVVYGEETLEENLDFIAQALGNKGDSSREIIRNYFLKDFFIDHCKIYQKRPIYWLFDSGKQNGFKALVYLHRYSPDTIGDLRIDYLHRMQRIYNGEINRMQDTIDHSDNSREVTKATKRKEKLQKQLKECQEYDEEISHLALSRIELDLDDGVKVNYEKLQTAQDGKKYQVLAKI